MLGHEPLAVHRLAAIDPLEVFRQHFVHTRVAGSAVG
jgi:hypothetical protein